MQKKDQLVTFGPETASGTYQVCCVGGLYHFHPTDRGWLAHNHNSDFSVPYFTPEAALQAAELWESQQVDVD